MWLGAQDKVPLVVARPVQITAPTGQTVTPRVVARFDGPIAGADRQGHQARHRRGDAARRPRRRISARGRRRRAAHGRVRPRHHHDPALPVRLALVTEDAAGRFITLEGGEGAGKSTQIARLKSWLEGARPSRHRHARARRLAGRGDDPQAAGRRPGRALGRHDRGAAAFRGAARASALDGVAGAEARRLGGERPLRRFDACLPGLRPRHRPHRSSSSSTRSRSAASGPTSRSSSTCRSRSASSGRPRGAASETRYESLPHDFHARVRAGFLEIAAREPKRCVVIDATRNSRCDRRRDRRCGEGSAGSLTDGEGQGERRRQRAGEARMALRLAAAVAQRAAAGPRGGREDHARGPRRAAGCTMPG